ncbi:MAG: MFS transporter [Sphingobacteriales bacterium]|jgi:FHS family glucose/mannose:H+ symporter-like MFS transporter|nr:MFS transporter [Sphingobacteriales bacterium]
MYNKAINFSIACLGMLLFGITLITVGAVLPDLKLKFALDEIAAGVLFAILPFGILAGSLVFGYFCDKYGYKGILILSCLLVVLGLAGIAILPSIDYLKICIFLFGFGGGCINGATNALVSDISHQNKGANLSLLGVFFAIGALGMPLILGVLKNSVGFEPILLSVAGFGLLIFLMMFLVKFPPAKNKNDVSFTHVFSLVKNKILLLIAFFLFFQSSLEAVIHNWITTYLNESLSIAKDKSLYALTLNVIGMAVMRLLIGTVFRRVTDRAMLSVSVLILMFSSILLYFTKSYWASSIALTLLGAGMAAGFPMMYSIVGKRHAEISATAFSFILSIALIGNMLVNYSMGIIAKNYGISQVPHMIFAEVVMMAILLFVVFKTDKSTSLSNVPDY